MYYGPINPMTITAWIFASLVLIFLYLLPTFIARKKENTVGVILLNIFLGWTFFGWIAALIWAASLRSRNYSQSANQSVYWSYTCIKCGFRKNFNQKLKMYKCPQCSEENFITD